MTRTLPPDDGWTSAGHRDGCTISGRWINPLTGRAMPNPEFKIVRGDKIKLFPPHPDNITHGGLVDHWFKMGGFGP